MGKCEGGLELEPEESEESMNWGSERERACSRD